MATAKNQINIQDQFLNRVRKEKRQVIIELTTGDKIQGVIFSFDNFCILIRGEGDQLVYKHAISSISTGEKVEIFDQK